MKKIIIIMLYLLPITLFSQYSEVWKVKEPLLNSKTGAICISKMKILSTNDILISKTNEIKTPELHILNQAGTVTHSHTNDMQFTTEKLKKGDYFVDESLPNKFLLQEGTTMSRYYNLLREKSNHETFSFSIGHWVNPTIFYFSSIGDKVNFLRSYTIVFDENNGLIYSDTTWFGNVVDNKRILQYTIASAGTINQNQKVYYLSPETLSEDPLKAVAVPTVIRQFSDKKFAVIVASEEVPSSEAVDLTIKIVDTMFKETSSKKILATNFNLNGSLLAIKDASIIGDYIYLLGVNYGKGTVKHPFFAKIHRDGQLFGFKILHNNAELCRLEKYTNNSLVAVGKQWSKDNETQIARKYIVELTDNLDIVHSAEIGTDEGYLKDVIVLHDGDLFVGGRDGETPYLAKLTKSTTSVQNQSSLPNIIIQSGMEIHPNPASNIATIELQKSLNGFGSITSYSLEGVEIRTIFNGEFTGKRSFTFPTEQLSNGTYTIVVRSTGATFSKLFQVIR